jgi:hypothetical protein
VSRKFSEQSQDINDIEKVTENALKPPPPLFPPTKFI